MPDESGEASQRMILATSEVVTSDLVGDCAVTLAICWVVKCLAVMGLFRIPGNTALATIPSWAKSAVSALTKP